MLSASRFDTLPSPLLANSCHQLRLDSTLEDLLLWDCEVESHHLGKDIAEKFNQNPLLPGVIMTEAGKYAGMISRRRFLEHLSRPYGVDLFLQRPVKFLYRFAHTQDLIFSNKTLIVDAAHQCLHRPPELLYEPVVVEVVPQDRRLLDLHELLIAQSQIHQLATQLLEQTRQKLETANEQLKRQVSIDGLTGIANRRRFDEYLEIEWRRLARENLVLCLILCDVDFFKTYNDTYGHQAGDVCLRTCASVLSNSVHRPADLVARYGGEEFAVILPNTDSGGGVHVAEAIRAGLHSLQLPHIGSESGFVSLSCGVACMIPNHETEPSVLISLADQALYDAKAQGRNCVVLKTL